MVGLCSKLRTRCWHSYRVKNVLHSPGRITAYPSVVENLTGLVTIHAMNHFKLEYFAVSLSILSVVWVDLSCTKKGPISPDDTAKMQIAVQYTLASEVWLEVSFPGRRDRQGVSREFTIERDGIQILSGKCIGPMAFVDDTTADPRHNYTYQAFQWDNSIAVDSTAPVLATTMDTTSHHFNFTTEILPGWTTSLLFDVSIINENSIWIVGSIYLLDSLGGKDPTPYCAAYWNGSKWTPKRFYYQGLKTTFLLDEIRGVCAFSDSDVWFAALSQLFHWDGTNLKMYQLWGGSIGTPLIQKLWGTSSNNLFGVGDSGAIVHFDGTTWQRIQSGVDVEIRDAWGGSNLLFGNNVVLFPASNKYEVGVEKILRFESSGQIDALIPWPYTKRLALSVWFDSHSPIYLCGQGIFEYRGGSGWHEITEVPLGVNNRIRGNGPNDIFVVGDFGVAAHYNGKTWRSYPEAELKFGLYESMAMKGNLVVAVGSNAPQGADAQAVVLWGRR